MPRTILSIVLGAALLACTNPKGSADDDATDDTTAASDSSSSEGSDAQDADGSSSSSTTTGAPMDTGFPGGCLNCSTLAMFVGMDPPDTTGGMPGESGDLPAPELCEGTDILLEALVVCGCAGTCAATCASACAATEIGVESFECIGCAVADAACADVFAACQADDPSMLPSDDDTGSTGPTDTTT